MHGVGILAHKEQVQWRIPLFRSMRQEHILFNSLHKTQVQDVLQQLRNPLLFRPTPILFLARIQLQTVRLDLYNLQVAQQYQARMFGPLEMVKPTPD